LVTEIRKLSLDDSSLVANSCSPPANYRVGSHMSLTLRKLRQKGYSTEDITLAQQQQEASRRAGAVARSLREILAGEQARPRIVAAPEDLTSRQLRRRGRYGQAALLADQEALNEKDPSRAIKAREASATLKELATRPPHLEFDLFRGNMMTADQYHDVIRTRLTHPIHGLEVVLLV